MLHEFLVGTYKQYKQDTKVLATWLSVTAKSMGYVSEALPALSKVSVRPKKSKAKSKQKTKKQLRDAARRIPREQRMFTISQKEFLPLAQYIVAHLKTDSRVPSSILSMITRVIEARKSSDAWFKANTQENDKDGHLHFILILEGVYEILKPHVAIAGKDGLDEQQKDAGIDNAYDVLPLEEPSQQFLDAPTPSRPNHKRMRVICEFVDTFFEHVESYFEELFAASSLFKDINNIYRHAEQVWYQYKEGKVDLMSAAIISNTAIELIRRLEGEFFEEFPRFRRIDEQVLRAHNKFDSKHQDAQQLINFMFRAKCNQKGATPFSRERSEARFNLDLFEDARYIFLDMHAISVTWFQGSQRMTKNVYDPGYYGSWDPNSNYQELSNFDKHRQDQRIMFELLPDMTLLSTTLSGIHSLAEDELLRGSRNLFAEAKKSPKIHLWMLASMRLFCDIHHILGRDIAKPFTNLRKLGESTINAIDEANKRKASGKTPSWSESVDEFVHFKLLDRMQQSLFVDEVKEYIDDAARNVKWWKGKRCFELLHRHPWACGLMEFVIRSDLQEVGLMASYQSESCVTAAHLYNALQKENALQAIWPDMEFFMDVLGDDQIFRGDRPCKRDEFSSRLSLMRGLSPETFARNRRDRGMLQSKRSRKFPFPKGDLIPALKHRYFMKEKHPEATNEDSTKFLIALELDMNQRIALHADGTQITVRARDDSGVARMSKASCHEQRKYSPIELLMALQFSLARELPKVMFDYLAFHTSCWEILKCAYGVYGPTLEQEMGPVGVALDQLEQYRLPFAVDLIFSLGVPYSTAKKMIRKVAMPMLPPVTHEYQQLLNQGAIFKAVGTAIGNKIANGRLRIQNNVRARKLIDARPELVCFDVQTVNVGGGRITFKKHKMWQHKNSACTKTICVCGVQPKSVFKPGWRQVVVDRAEEVLDNVKESMAD